MKISKFVVFGILIFLTCFAGFRPQPSSFFAYRQDNFLFPNPQVLVQGVWNPVEFTNVQWIGDQFTWMPSIPAQVNLARGPYHPIALVMIKSNASLCQAHLVYKTADGTRTELGITGLPSVNGMVIMPVEPYGFLENRVRGSSVILEVQCNAEGSVSAATLYLVNQ